MPLCSFSFSCFTALKNPLHIRESNFQKAIPPFSPLSEWYSHGSSGKINNEVLDFVSLCLYDICVIAVALIHIQVFLFGVQ